jgi:DNA-binding NarL/FixJ family response regulator
MYPGYAAQPIRIVLAEMPPKLHDIIEAIVAPHPDLRIVARVVGRDGLLAAVNSTSADVMILELHDAESPSVLDGLLYECPRLKVLATTSDGRGTFVRELLPNEVALGDLSPEHLLVAIRMVHPNPSEPIRP